MHYKEQTWTPRHLPDNIKSHQTRSLKDHLEGTYNLAKFLSERNRVPVDLEKLKWVCWTHDLGKIKPDFQETLEKKEKSGKVPHAEHSSWFTLAATHDLMCAEAVRRHHSHICGYNGISSYWAHDDMTAKKIHGTCRKLIPDWSYMLPQDDIFNFVYSLPVEEKAFLEEYWLRFKTLFSLFITADRMDAMKIQNIDGAFIPDWKPKTFSTATPLDSWRSEVRRLCVEAADNMDIPGIYTLSLPTGSGKTLIGLEIAYRWAKKKGLSNIIYALPFISIVEQNAQVASEVFGEESVQEDHSFVYVTDDEAEEPIPEKRMQSFFRYWNSPVVVTTLAQLWRSIFGAKANESMNFHRLSNAVVILDEPQAIDAKLWKGFSKILNLVSERLNTTFLLMTATKPYDINGQELAPVEAVARRPYKTRYKCQYIDGVHELEKLPSLLEGNIKRLYNASGLVVLNAKESAFKAYSMLKDILGQNAPVLFLSGWVAPKHRKEILKKLHNLEEAKKQRYLISTQVVEAGVDLDFEWVFRDLGPLDSIVQVAGRCNRHFSMMKELGEVLIAEMKDKTGKTILNGSKVYGSVLIDTTKKILAEKPVFDEQDTIEMVNKYFGILHEEALKADALDTSIQNGEWGSLPELIEDRQYSKQVSLYIELDDNLQKLLKELSSMTRSLENVSRARNIARKLQMYRIDVPLKHITAWKDKLRTNFISDTSQTILEEQQEEKQREKGGYILHKEGIGTVYRMDCGFVPPDCVELQ
ncbi:CRISPR-associated helicase Cas3' [Thermovirga lienii]|uniref:CRISPR-associated helicase Cas3' n=1 Tax=Thermovirga lienii TaxID=336261 RepID=UPI002FE27F3B